MGSHEHAPGGKPGQLRAYDADGGAIWLDTSEHQLDILTIRCQELDSALRALQAQMSMRAWVPVISQKPPIGVHFLAFGPGLGMHVNGPTMDICLWDGDVLWDEHGTELVCSGVRCTHWQPLPHSPKFGA